MTDERRAVIEVEVECCTCCEAKCVVRGTPYPRFGEPHWLMEVDQSTVPAGWYVEVNSWGGTRTEPMTSVLEVTCPNCARDHLTKGER